MNNKYALFAALNNGETLDLSDIVIKLSWGDSSGEIAAKASITLAQAKYGGGNIADVLKLCSHIIIKAGGATMFEGTIWEWECSADRERTLDLIAYDPLIYATKCKDNNYYSAGKSTAAIISDICGKWKIPLNYKWGSITNQKTVYNNKTVADQIMQTISEAERQLGKTSVALYKGGKLVIAPKGGNSVIHVFDETSSVISADRRLTLDRLVTKVIIVGKKDGEGRTPVEKAILGKTEYGTLQEIVSRTGDSTVADAAKEANELLAERGKPAEVINAEVCDVPEVRKGDKVKVTAGNLDGSFFVKSVTHAAHTGKMSMELEAADSAATPIPKTEAKNSGFKKGDSVILNGPVYVDSYGNGKGRTFTDYHSTITIVADTARKCPYHIGAIGWAMASELKKG